MKKINLIFPGQGSQYVGMFNSFDNEDFNRTFTEASEALNIDLKDLCLNGPEEKLKQTEFTQPAIVTHSVACFKVLKNILDKQNIEIENVLGHSVGEYSALVASGSLSLLNAVKAVNQRGKYMQEAVPEGQGKMFAILRVPREKIIEACNVVSTEQEKVMPANFNEPGQTVISGSSLACDKVVEWLKANYEGKQMAIPLKVSAPFHCDLMLPAQSKMECFLRDIEISSNSIPYIANIDGKIKNQISANEIKENLTKQISGSVLWTQSLESFCDESIFIEVGPGKVLTGLNKKINKTFKTFTMDQDDSLNKLEGFLNECNL